MSNRSRADTYHDGRFEDANQLDESYASNISKLSRLQQIANQPANLRARMAAMGKTK